MPSLVVLSVVPTPGTHDSNSRAEGGCPSHPSKMVQPSLTSVLATHDSIYQSCEWGVENYVIHHMANEKINRRKLDS